MSDRNRLQVALPTSPARKGVWAVVSTETAVDEERDRSGDCLEGDTDNFFDILNRYVEVEGDVPQRSPGLVAIRDVLHANDIVRTPFGTTITFLEIGSLNCRAASRCIRDPSKGVLNDRNDEVLGPNNCPATASCPSYHRRSGSARHNLQVLIVAARDRVRCSVERPRSDRSVIPPLSDRSV